jgi:RNA polymerase sigma-70 factor, ECF subfamily
VVATLAASRQTKSEEHPNDEADAVRAAQNPAAFEPLYLRYLAPVYAYCYRRLGHRQAAEDATSLVFQKALSGISGFKGGSFRAWLYRIVHNVVADAWRSLEKTQDLDLAASVFDPNPGPQERSELSERERALHAALGQLPAEWRRILELRLAGLSGKEIAAVTGRSPEAVRISQHRAMQQLRVILSEHRPHLEVDHEV